MYYLAHNAAGVHDRLAVVDTVALTLVDDDLLAKRLQLHFHQFRHQHPLPEAHGRFQ